MSEKSKHHRGTMEIYRDLLHIEVRSLVQRVAELTGTVTELFGEVSTIAIQLEESVENMQRLSGGVDYCRDELGAIRQTIGAHESLVKQLQEKISMLDTQVTELKQGKPCNCSDGTCKHDWPK